MRARAAAPVALAAALAAAAWLTAAAAVAGESAPRRWGLGWDGQQHGLVLRWRPAAAWDLSAMAGPDDSRLDRDVLSRDFDHVPPETSESTRYRQESGWVRLSGARRLAAAGPCELSFEAGVRYLWSNEQNNDRRPYISVDSVDYRNQQRSTESDQVSLSLALRPAVAVSARLTLEMEAGLLYVTTDTHETYREWFDVRPDHVEESTASTTHAFRSFGPTYDFWRVRLIFWL